MTRPTSGWARLPSRPVQREHAIRARLIFNPNATTTTNAVRDALAGLLGDELELRVSGTIARDHATDLTREAVAEGVDAVFALGGDGTANEVLQAVAGTDVAFGLLPGGGTNVLARALGLPNEPALAARMQLEELFAGHDHRFGIGSANGRFFGFQAGIGLDAAIVQRVEAHPAMKRRLRQAAFVLLGLQEWGRNEDRREPAVTVQDVPGIAPTPRMLAVAGNVDPYTYLGPRALRLVPTASASAALDVLAADAMPTRRVLASLGRAFLDGRHVHEPGFALAHDVRSATFTASRPRPWMVDGEHVGHTEVLRLRHHPAHVRVLVAPREEQQDPRPIGRSDAA